MNEPMETSYKNRVLFWLLMFLIIVNLAALATYFFFPLNGNKQECGETFMKNGCLYRTQLDLSDEQAIVVEEISDKYLEATGSLAAEIKSVRGMILDELSKPTPDSMLLNELISDITRMQGRLQKENIKHYLAVKDVCSPEQAMQLSNLYRELYGCPMHNGNGIKQRHRHGN